MRWHRNPIWRVLWQTFRVEWERESSYWCERYRNAEGQSSGNSCKKGQPPELSWDGIPVSNWFYCEKVKWLKVVIWDFFLPYFIKICNPNAEDFLSWQVSGGSLSTLAKSCQPELYKRVNISLCFWLTSHFLFLLFWNYYSHFCSSRNWHYSPSKWIIKLRRSLITVALQGHFRYGMVVSVNFDCGAGAACAPVLVCQEGSTLDLEELFHSLAALER